MKICKSIPTMANLDDLMDHSFSSPPPEDFEPFTPGPRGHQSDNLLPGSVPAGNATFLFPSLQNTPSLPSSNIMTFARRYAMQRHLKQAQLQEVMDFIHVSEILSTKQRSRFKLLYNDSTPWMSASSCFMWPSSRAGISRSNVLVSWLHGFRLQPQR